MASGWGSTGYASNPFAGGGAGAPSAPPPPSNAPWAPAAGGSGAAVPSIPPAMVAAAAGAAARDKRVQRGFLGALGIGGGAPAAEDAAREQELARREAAVAAREAELGLSPGAPAPNGLLPAGGGTPRANWPPCAPLIRHSIAEGVVPWHRPTVRFAYLVELLEIGAFVFNCVALVAALIAGVGPGLSWWLISLVAVCLGVPGSWLLWYKQLWSAVNSNGSTYAFARELVLLLLNAGAFFPSWFSSLFSLAVVVFSFFSLTRRSLSTLLPPSKKPTNNKQKPTPNHQQIKKQQPKAWGVWMIIAAKGLGDFSAGIFPMLGHFNRNDAKGIAFGVIYVINVALWAGVTFGTWVCVGLAIRAYRAGGDPAREYEARYGAPATVVA
jgi:hypothetical protein